MRDCAFVAALFAGALPACGRRASSTSPGADVSTRTPVALSVPAALTLARALDTLSVGIDPASLARIDVRVDPGMIVGVESDLVVFGQGQPRPTEGRHGLSSSAAFDVGTSTWSTGRDGLPVPGVKYVAVMDVVLFETDVPPGPSWDPHAGRYRALWTRTLQQAEE